MSLTFLIHFQQVHVLFYLKEFVHLIFLVYHQNLSYLLNYQIDFCLLSSICFNLAAKRFDVNFWSSNIFIIIMINNVIFNFIKFCLLVSFFD